MNLLLRFQNIIKEQYLFSPKDKLIIAVSGGIDSVVLCELCQQTRYDFIIAHCNFQLRGEESERDEQFVRELGKKYGVEVLVQQFDTNKYTAENKLSTQEAARELRYNWFAELVRSNNPKPDGRNFLLTAHHADDNNETVLMNFFRGTGLHGLTGIPAKNDYIRRPLLNFYKEELLEYAYQSKLDFVEDSSNQSSKYTRNFFRNELIPSISQVYPQVKNNLQDNIYRFKEIEKLYKFSVGEIKRKLCKYKGSEIHIPVKQLLQYNNRALIYEIISEYGFTEKQVDETIKLASSNSGKYIESRDLNFRIIKHRHWFIITPVQSAGVANIIIEEKDNHVLFDGGKLSVEMILTGKMFAVNAGSTLQSANSIALLDAGKIKFPLLLRKRKTGDYFYPLGMKKKKKINRFLIDQKLSLIEKENIWLIESAQHIIWIAGHRIDDRFKVSDSTKKVLRITIEK